MIYIDSVRTEMITI